MKQLAQGIASLGRGEDTQLVHMTPGEVRGLQQLALAHGGSLTINPKTGLAEAGFLSSMLPMLIGGALTVFSGGALSPMAAAMMTGAGFGLAKGSLKEGLMAGLGAYGGAGLAGSLGEAGATSLANTAQTEGLKEAGITQMGGAGAGESPFANQAYSQYADSVQAGGDTPVGQEEFTKTPDFQAQQNAKIAEVANANPVTKYADMTPSGRMSAMGRGASDIASNPFGASSMDFLDKNKYQLAGALAGPALEALKPQAPMAPAKPQPDQYDLELAKYHLNPDYKAYVPSQPNPYYRAQYAKGGDVGQPKYEGRDPRSASIPDVGIIKLDDISTASKDPYEAALIRLKEAANRANLNYAAPTIASTPASPALKGLGDIGKPTTMMAGGGVARGYGFGGEISGSATEGSAPVMSGGSHHWWDSLTGVDSNNQSNMGGILSTLFKQNPDLMNQLKGPNKMAQGGITSLPSEYAAGGKLLQGPGDGMSDSIPAVIKGPRPQRAALAQGEFVVPADVVSHLGNGSTDAGAKKLYAMMDKIRHARTGNKKQGKQINPNNFMPA